MIAMAEANKELVQNLERILALARNGILTDAVVVATGKDRYENVFSVPRPEGMVGMIGEVEVMVQNMKLMVLEQRTLAQQKMAPPPGIRHFQG
jgi:hypothetical protein